MLGLDERINKYYPCFFLQVFGIKSHIWASWRSLFQSEKPTFPVMCFMTAVTPFSHVVNRFAVSYIINTLVLKTKREKECQEKMF